MYDSGLLTSFLAEISSRASSIHSSGMSGYARVNLVAIELVCASVNCPSVLIAVRILIVSSCTADSLTPNVLLDVSGDVLVVCWAVSYTHLTLPTIYSV